MSSKRSWLSRIRDYFEHGGINVEAMARAAIKDIKARKLVEGASTLTQQLIKNLALSREKKFTRKIKEVVLAMKLESELSKEDIIERYLNHVYFGHGYYGIKTAAEGYFRKELNELSIKRDSDASWHAKSAQAPMILQSTSTSRLAAQTGFLRGCIASAG